MMIQKMGNLEDGKLEDGGLGDGELEVAKLADGNQRMGNQEMGNQRLGIEVEVAVEVQQLNHYQLTNKCPLTDGFEIAIYRK